MGILKEALQKAANVRYAKYLDALARSGNLDKLELVTSRLIHSPSAIHGKLGGVTPRINLLGAALGSPLGEKLTSEELAILAKKAIREANKVDTAAQTRPLWQRAIEYRNDKRELGRVVAEAPPWKPSQWFAKSVKAARSRKGLVPFTHGGGYPSAIDFFAGKSKGYPLARGNHTGIQVSPRDTSSRINNKVSADVDAETYARMAGFKHGQSPAITSGSIRRSDLEAGLGEHQAGLPVEKMHNAVGVMVRKLPRKWTGDAINHVHGVSSGSIDVGYLPPKLRDKLRSYDGLTRLPY